MHLISWIMFKFLSDCIIWMNNCILNNNQQVIYESLFNNILIYWSSNYIKKENIFKWKTKGIMVLKLCIMYIIY